jgi:hypothetical protein
MVVVVGSHHSFLHPEDIQRDVVRSFQVTYVGTEAQFRAKATWNKIVRAHAVAPESILEASPLARKQHINNNTNLYVVVVGGLMVFSICE